MLCFIPLLLLKPGEQLLQFLLRFQDIVWNFGMVFKKVTMKGLWNCIVNSWLFGMLVILRTFRRVSNMLRLFRDCLKLTPEDQCLKRDRKRVFGSKRRFGMLEF